MRRYERVRFFCRVNLTVLPQGSPVLSQSMDLSIGGVAVATRARVSVGQNVAVDFLLNRAGQTAIKEQVLGRVVNIRAETDGNIIGIEFWRVLSSSQQPELYRKMMSL